MKFLKKTKSCNLAPIDANVIQKAIRGIRNTINRLKRKAYVRSRNAKYVFSREEKIEKLQLIVIDLKRLL